MSDIPRQADPSAAATPKPKRTLGTRDGLFQRNGWWWIDYHDADGQRHRKKVSPDYDTAKKKYRATMTAIARGEVLGVREEGLRLKDFVENRYWPAVKGTLAPEWAARSRAMLDVVLLPRFGDLRLSAIRREPIEAWYAERLDQVSSTTANKELARLKHLLGRAETWGRRARSNAPERHQAACATSAPKSTPRS